MAELPRYSLPDTSLGPRYSGIWRSVSATDTPEIRPLPAGGSRFYPDLTRHPVRRLQHREGGRTTTIFGRSYIVLVANIAYEFLALRTLEMDFVKP